MKFFSFYLVLLLFISFSVTENLLAEELKADGYTVTIDSIVDDFGYLKVSGQITKGEDAKPCNSLKIVIYAVSDDDRSQSVCAYIRKPLSAGETSSFEGQYGKLYSVERHKRWSSTGVISIECLSDHTQTNPNINDD